MVPLEGVSLEAVRTFCAERAGCLYPARVPYGEDFVTRELRFEELTTKQVVDSVVMPATCTEGGAGTSFAHVLASEVRATYAA